MDPNQEALDKVRQVFWIMVHGKKEPNEKPLSERVYRGLLHYVESNDGSKKALIDALNSQEYISMTTSTLRFLILS